MLEYGKFKDRMNEHKAIAKDMLDYFKEDPEERLIAGRFANGGKYQNTTGPNATQFCLRGAWHQLIGNDAWISDRDSEEKEFFQFLGFEGTYYSNSASEAAVFNNQEIRAGNYHAILERLEKAAA